MRSRSREPSQMGQSSSQCINPFARTRKMIPGEYFLNSEPIELNKGLATTLIKVTNRGDRPIQVGSHCHFFEVNKGLDFDRGAAYGMRLNIPAGTAVRFEPGDTKEIELVALSGTRTVYGINGLVNGKLK